MNFFSFIRHEQQILRKNIGSYFLCLDKKFQKRGASHTPVTTKETFDNLHEEIADVLVCCDVLPLDWAKIHDIEQKKSDKVLEDLEKAAWYLNREIERRKENKSKKELKHGSACYFYGRNC